MKKTISLSEKKYLGSSRVMVENGVMAEHGLVTMYVDTTWVTRNTVGVAMTHEEVRELIETLSEFLEQS